MANHLVKREPSSREYERLRRLRVEFLKENNPQKGIPLTEEVKKRISESKKGKKHEIWELSDAGREAISKTHKGKIVSEETRQKMREAKLGVPKTEEWKKKISEKTKGRQKSEETKERMREAWKKRLRVDKNLKKQKKNIS